MYVCSRNNQSMLISLSSHQFSQRSSEPYNAMLHACTICTSEGRVGKQTCDLQAYILYCILCTPPSPLPSFCVEPQMLMITSGPPGGMPPMGMPPGGIPPGVMPPGGMPPGVMPGQFPPQAYPQQPGFY